MEKALWISSVIFCSLYALSHLAHASARRQAEAIVLAKEVKPSQAASGVTGSLQIPSLHLTVPVLAGCSFAHLEQGACHLEGSANFGGLGNAAVAAHRDKDFRPLEHIRKGMEILVGDGGEQHRYVVDSFEIVAPEDVEVLAIHDRPELTLITCYPFHYIGSAPKRFIVHAHLVISVSPAAPGDSV